MVRKGEVTRVMDDLAIKRSLSRMASEILEKCGSPRLRIGWYLGGWALRLRTVGRFDRSVGRHRPQTGSLDITLYRDDLYTGLEKPILGETRLPFKVSGTEFVLVDDVCLMVEPSGLRWMRSGIMGVRLGFGSRC